MPRACTGAMLATPPGGPPATPHPAPGTRSRRTRTPCRRRPRSRCGSSHDGAPDADVAADGLPAHLDHVLAVSRRLAGVELRAHLTAQRAEIEPDRRPRRDRHVDVARHGVDAERAEVDALDAQVA